MDDWHALDLEASALVEQLARCSGPLTLLVASRQPPQASRSSLVDHLLALELEGLSLQDTRALLGGRARPEEVAAIHEASGGHPFLSTLLAETPGALVDVGRPGLAEGAALRLVDHLASAVSGGLRRAALDPMALVGHLNEHELRAVLDLDPSAGRALFDELRGLPIVQTTASGLSVHPALQSALVADLLVRDPPGARALVAALLGPIEAALSWPGQPRTRALAQLNALIAAAPQDPAMANMFSLGGVELRQGTLADVPAALDLVEAHEGAVAREIAARWIAADPATLTVSTTGDDVTGV
ncbi:MAG: hypothetical protein KC621_35470, partial [Myxococcales bacterium]|nr:hypothetical protein [Myxococcales bacterium]